MDSAIKCYVPDTAAPAFRDTYLYKLEGVEAFGFIEIGTVTMSGSNWKAEVGFLDVEETSWIISREEWLELIAEGRLCQVPSVGAEYDYQPVQHRPPVARIEVEDHTLDSDAWGVVCSYDFNEASDHAPNSQEVLALKHHFAHPIGSEEWEKMVARGYLVKVHKVPAVRR